MPLNLFYTMVQKSQKWPKTQIKGGSCLNAKHSTSWDCQTTDNAGVLLANMACQHSLSQLVEGPTRAAGTPQATQLDLVFTDRADLVESCTVLSPVADHCPTVMKLKLSAKEDSCSSAQKHQFRNYTNVNMAQLNDILQDANWFQVYSASNTENALSAFYDVLFSMLDKHAPLVTTPFSRSSNKPWYSAYLCRLRRLRDRLFRKSKSVPVSHKITLAYKRVRNLYVCELRSADRDYFRRISFNLSLDQLRDQPHKWWSVAKKVCGLKHNEAIPSLISADQRISTSPVEKAECLNSSFSEQCNAPSPAELPNCTPQLECRFSFKMIEPLDVLKKLVSLNSWKAPGIDNLQNYCLGSSRGKSRLLRWLSRWLHSHLHGENDERLHSSSVFPSEVAAVCLVVFGSLFCSLLWCRLETTGLFWANESAIKLRRSKNIRSRSFRSGMSETSEFALAFIESLAKLATASPFFKFSQNWAFFTFSFSQSQVKLSVDRWGEADGAPQFQERRCSVDLHRLKPVSLPSLADVDPNALLWAPEASQACNGRSWKKRGHAREEREWRQERLSCNVKKPEGSNKLKRVAALLWLAGAFSGIIVKLMSSHFFPHFQSCWALLLFSKQGGSRWKRYFCFRLRGWSANVPRLHWSSCQCRYLSNWLDSPSHPYLSKVLCRLFCVFAWRSASVVKLLVAKTTKLSV